MTINHSACMLAHTELRCVRNRVGKSRDRDTCSRYHLANWFHKLRFTRVVLRWPSHSDVCAPTFSKTIELKPNSPEKLRKINLLQLIISSAVLRGYDNRRCCCWSSSTLFEYFIWNWFRKLLKLIIGQARLSPQTIPNPNHQCFLGEERRKLISVFCLTSLWLDRVYSFRLASFNCK